MNLWLLKAAGTLEDEEAILENNVITIGWSEFPDLSSTENKAQVKQVMLEKYPGMQEERCEAWAGEINSFIKDLRLGDFVAVPLKTRNEVIIGKVSGDYEYREVSPFVSHVRNVRWLKTLLKGDFEEEYDVDLNSPETLLQVRASKEKLARFMEIKSLGTLHYELALALEDLELLREQLQELLVRLLETEDLSKAKLIATEMEKLLREKTIG
ncbi:restriction endonuclease [Methanosarcina sp. Mfa9]|uniref:restriction endonuclease n=1 Tax=Methanosarcina sp. Mfa9 TaxID=3439063 RepID=UPI003F871F24